ncbi:MAG TPA: MarR family winged helix-turn-helix transcriptional regulator [Usitatibacteraceae bacterium]
MSTSTLERTKRAPSRAAATPVPLPCTGARLRRLTRRMTSFYEQHLRGLGLKLGQYSVLVHLGREPQTLMHLADELEMDRTTLTRGIQPLIEHGWVSEVPGSDARQRCFVLTAQGERFRQDAEAQWCQAQLALEARLGRDFTANLQAQLDQALDRLKPALAEDN